tara:strand:+ start:6545 stop:6745 length:201 start_codon:yes stop_codon:yes gene_type:complete
MPYQIKKQVNENKTVYKLFNLNTKKFVKTNYKSKESAVKAGMNFMRYRKEEPYLKGNKLLNRKKKK